MGVRSAQLRPLSSTSASSPTRSESLFIVSLLLCSLQPSIKVNAFVVGRPITHRTALSIPASTGIGSRCVSTTFNRYETDLKVSSEDKVNGEESLATPATSAQSPLALLGGPTRVAQLQRLVDPVQKLLDKSTDGWAMSAANLSPASEKTITGRVFLATNLGYAVTGLILTWSGDFWFGLLTDLAAIASFNYHYQQLLDSRPDIDSVQTPEMRLALLLDYIVAAVSILTGAVYLWQTAGQSVVPAETIEIAALSVACLAACWVWEKGQPYIVFHSAWHLFSAYAGYLIGSMHQTTGLS